MKTLILYATKTGATKKCATLLSSYLEKADMLDINEIKSVDITHYDQMIIGSYVRIGMVDKKIKKFIIQNKEILKEKCTSIFLCCGFDENMKQYFHDNIPSDLLEKLITYDSFGGELDLIKQKGIDKLIVKMVMKANPSREVKLLNDNIKTFFNKLKK